MPRIDRDPNYVPRIYRGPQRKKAGIPGPDPIEDAFHRIDDRVGAGMDKVHDTLEPVAHAVVDAWGWVARQLPDFGIHTHTDLTKDPRHLSLEDIRNGIKNRQETEMEILSGRLAAGDIDDDLLEFNFGERGIGGIFALLRYYYEQKEIYDSWSIDQIADLLTPPRLSQYTHAYFYEFTDIAYGIPLLGAPVEDLARPIFYPVKESPHTLFIGDHKEQIKFLASLAAAADWADRFPDGRARLQRTVLVCGSRDSIPSFRDISRLPTLGDETINKAGSVFLDERDMREQLEVILNERAQGPYARNVRRHRMILIEDFPHLSRGLKDSLMKLVTSQPDGPFTHVIATASAQDYLSPAMYKEWDLTLLGRIDPQTQTPATAEWEDAKNLPPWQFLDFGENGPKPHWIIKP